jgi:hypothetical protein
MAVVTPVEVSQQETSISFAEFIDNYNSMRDSSAHFQLRHHLIKYQWAIKGQQEEEKNEQDVKMIESIAFLKQY